MADELYLNERQLSLLINLVNTQRKKRIRRKERYPFTPEPGCRDLDADYINRLEEVAFILREARRAITEGEVAS